MEGDDLREGLLAGETVFRGVVIDVEHRRVSLPDGNTALREIVRHKGAVAVIPVDDEGCVTLVRQYRPAIDRVTLEIPAGKLDAPDEEPLAAAVRELEEETGLRAACWRKLTRLDVTPGFCDERITLFLARGLSQHAAHTDDDEFLRVERMPLSQAVNNVMAGEIRDSKTVAGLLMALRACADTSTI